MKSATELINALNQIEKEKGIDREVIFEAIEYSLKTAFKKNFGGSQDPKVVMDRKTGKVDVYAQKTVVEEVTNESTEISLEQAKAIKLAYDIGDVVDIVVTPRDFGRISAQTAKQVVVQKFREAEREILYNKFRLKEDDIMTGIVKRRDKKNIIIELDKIEFPLPPGEQIPGEVYKYEERTKVYITEVKKTTKGPQIVISRVHPGLVKRLFEQRVDEIYDGTVEIKAIAREAGSRSKMAVKSNNPSVDPVGACVGQNGARVNDVVNDLKGEKIDIIKWNADPRIFIASAISPSDVLAVVVNESEHSAKIVVPDRQLSLAIGKEGQNARLAAKLTGWRIDIKGEKAAREMNFIPEEEYFSNIFSEQSSFEALTSAARNKQATVLSEEEAEEQYKEFYAELEENNDSEDEN